MKRRTYCMKLSGEDREGIAFLGERLPKSYNSLGAAREMARAIQVLFPKIKVGITSILQPQAAQAMKVKTL